MIQSAYGRGVMGMSRINIWRTRVAYLIITCGLWMAAWPLREYPLAMRIILGLAVLANVLFILATFTAPTADAFELGEGVGKAIGYQNGFRDGFEHGAHLYSPANAKAPLHEATETREGELSSP